PRTMQVLIRTKPLSPFLETPLIIDGLASKIDQLVGARRLRLVASSDRRDPSPAWYVSQSPHNCAGVVAPFRTPWHFQIDYGTGSPTPAHLCKHRNRRHHPRSKSKVVPSRIARLLPHTSRSARSASQIARCRHCAQSHPARYPDRNSSRRIDRRIL